MSEMSRKNADERIGEYLVWRGKSVLGEKKIAQ